NSDDGKQPRISNDSTIWRRHRSIPTERTQRRETNRSSLCFTFMYSTGMRRIRHCRQGLSKVCFDCKVSRVRWTYSRLTGKVTLERRSTFPDTRLYAHWLPLVYNPFTLCL